MSTENKNNYKDISWYFCITARTQEYKATKPDSETLDKWKEVIGKPDKTNELTLKTKAHLKEPDNIDSQP